MSRTDPTDQFARHGDRYLRSRELHDIATKLLPGGVNSHFRLGGHPVPLFFERGTGAHLWDVDGNRYIDYVLGMGPNILGHAPASVTAAVAESLGLGQLYAGQYEAELQLAERLRTMMPSAQESRFGLSGSEMAHAAVRLARAATGRLRVLKFEGHYHGWLDSILASVWPSTPSSISVGSGPYAPRLGSLGQDPNSLANVDVIQWNDIDAWRTYMLERGDDVGTVIMEPIQCNTGVILPSPGYLEEVRLECDRRGIVLIFDEVITGLRVGMSGAQGLLGVTPDLTIIAKALGAGFPIAGLVGRRDLMSLLGNGDVVHGGTYNANRVSIAAACAATEELCRANGAVYGKMYTLGERLMNGLRASAAARGVDLLVQGLGTVFNTTFTHGPIINVRDYNLASRDRQVQFLNALQDRGVRVTSRGTWFLSGAHTDRDVDETIAAADDALGEMGS